MNERTNERHSEKHIYIYIVFCVRPSKQIVEGEKSVLFIHKPVLPVTPTLHAAQREIKT